MILIPLGLSLNHLCRQLFYGIRMTVQVFFLTLSLKINYRPLITHNKNYLQQGSVVSYASSKKMEMFSRCKIYISLSLLCIQLFKDQVLFSERWRSHYIKKAIPLVL